MAFTPYSGTGGRVRHRTLGVNLAGIKSWKIPTKTTPIPIPHFELTADTNGAVWQTAWLKGLSEGTIQLEGTFDATTTGSAFAHGTNLALDLLFDKTAPFGYYNVTGFVTDFQPGTNVENQAGTFTITVQMTSALPTPGSS